jgi:phosphoglycerol transferase MdoB-like AlkP superfamily enzyme
MAAAGDERGGFVGIAQAIESGRTMKALALLGVFLVAKLAILAGRPVEISLWAPIAYIWQDVLVVLIFALLDRLVRRPWFGWILYGGAVAYVTINVPIARVLSSPLTRQMLSAAGGTLAGSIKHHATPANLAFMALVVVVALALPWFLSGAQLRRPVRLIIPALLIVGLGPLARARVETVGLDRNAIMALVSTSLPRLSEQAPKDADEKDWRATPLDTPPRSDNLTGWQGTAAGRNVVLIVLESAAAQYLQTYGASQDPMPNLSALTREAIVFENAYTVYPESIKAFFSVLCSRYPAPDIASEQYAKIQTPSLALLLRAAGYRTALLHSGRFMYLGMEAVVQNRGYEVLEDAGAIGGNYESSFGVEEASTVRRALAWIDSLPRHEPFFLTYLPIAGHHPYDTPEPGPFPESGESDRYLNALHYADASLGSLLEGLRERGLAEHTLFVIFGDHGQAFNQHEGNYGHSIFLYEENIRVPYLIAAPGLIDKQTRVAQPISLIDTAPTILALLGQASPPDYQGHNTLAGAPGMALFYTDYSLRLMGLRDGCWKYIYEFDSGRSKLFNLCLDATELNDLSALHPERIAAYHDHLAHWSAAQKALILNQSN